MANDKDKDMFGEFFSTVFKFIWKMFLWAAWALLRASELICGGIASWIKNNLTK